MKKPNAQFSQPEHAGYMPNRGDFETEWDNDVELILCDMVFGDDDTPVERGIKDPLITEIISRSEVEDFRDLQSEVG